MSSLLEHYKVLGVNVGAGIADVTSSYKRLCRIYHPDVSDDPGSEELMKRINIAYTVLREKFRREAAVRDRQPYTRTARRYASAEPRPVGTDIRKSTVDAEKEAYTVLHDYFRAINAFDYSGAYNYLSAYDKRHITRESFIKWRKSVARLHPMREFRIAPDSTLAKITWSDSRTLCARKFHVEVTEEDYKEGDTHSGDVEKLVVDENNQWKVFLGYEGVGELTRTFDERFEIRLKRDIAKRWEEYSSGLYPEYDMLSLNGMRKTVSREIYRQQRYGGTITFVAISVKAGGMRATGQEQLLRSAARTIVATLRESDVPAYAGDGVFALLLVELSKKNAEETIDRLIEKMRKNAGGQLGARADIDFEIETWSGSHTVNMDGLNRVLKKFSKKM